MTSILLARQTTKRAARYISTVGFSEVKVKAGTSIFQKADSKGPVAGIVPEDRESILVDYATQGLSDDTWYWKAMSVPDDKSEVTGYIHGYVLATDVIS